MLGNIFRVLISLGMHRFENSPYLDRHLDWAVSIEPFDLIFVTFDGLFLWSLHIYRFYISKGIIKKLYSPAITGPVILILTFLSAEHLTNAARSSFGSGLVIVLWIGIGLEVSDGMNFALSKPGSSEIKLDVFEFVDNEDFQRDPCSVFYLVLDI